MPSGIMLTIILLYLMCGMKKVFLQMSYLLPVSAQVIKKIQDGKTDCIYIKNTYKLGYESIQMLDTYSRNKYMKDISIPCHKVDKAAIESGELDALLTN